MGKYFDCKVRYDKMTESGVVKKVTEAFIVDAMSFTEAEARIIKEITAFLSGSFTITAIKRAKITEVFTNESAEGWWLVKANFISLDEKSGKEKKSANYILVQADDSEGAQEVFENGMKGTMADYEVVGINETNCHDVFFIQSDN